MGALNTISSWEPGSEVTLCNVPWNSDYRDIVKFDSDTVLDAYLDSVSGPRITIERVTYCKPNTPIKLPVTMNDSYTFNYMRVRNSAPGDRSKTFYYFIQDVQYASPGATIFHVMLDVWQTFNRDVEFGNCFVERGHLGIANENQWNNLGRDFLTVPEGLDLGSDYEVQRVDYLFGHGPQDNKAPLTNVAVISSVILSSKDVDSEGTGIVNSPPTINEGLIQGQRTYLFASGDEAYNKLLNMKPWVVQGISAIITIPDVLSWPDNDLFLATETLPNGETVKYIGGNSGRYDQIVENTTDSHSAGNIKFDWRYDIRRGLGRYSALRKFLVSPYTIVEASVMNGAPVVYKPELMTIDMSFRRTFHLASSSPRIVYTPINYASNNSPDNHYVYTYGRENYLLHDAGEFIDAGVTMSNFPTAAVTVSGYAAFMASNKNMLAYQRDSADWSQQRALRGVNLASEQATAATGAQWQQTAIANSALGQQAGIANDASRWGTALGIGGSLAGGVSGASPASIAGGAVSAASSMLGTTIETNARNQSTEVTRQTAIDMTASSTALSGFVRDTNAAYGKYAAAGDYQNAIAGINAKVQDATMIQPSVHGQVGGDAFAIARQWDFRLWVKIKMVNAAARAAIGEYWLRFGYAVNRFYTPPPSLMVMSKFTYWKMSQTYIRSSTCPEGYRQTIRGIFEKGITVWKNPDDIGVIDIADNTPLPGIKLEV